MKLCDLILEILDTRNDFVSGQELAEVLSVSRNAVWKAIKQLQLDGFLIESSKTKGYRLSPDNSRLFVSQIKRFANCSEVILLDEIDSTNNYAKALADGGANENTLIITRRQTAGKGRLGRTFFSEEGGLYMSLILKPQIDLKESLQITVAAAAAAARAIEKVCDIKTQIKWVNDIYVSSKKVCGILTEGAISAEDARLQYAVLGIGINVAKPKGNFDKSIKNIAASLFPDETVCSKIYARLIGEFLSYFYKYYADLSKREYIPFYRSHSLLDGKKITYQKENKAHTAKVLGIGDNAELIIEEKGERLLLSAGEVTIGAAGNGLFSLKRRGSI